jgi:hypothetical protein
MTSITSDPPAPSELDEEVDDALLLPRHVWAYPCKLSLRVLTMPSPGTCEATFYPILQEQVAHGSTATSAARRVSEMEWRYTPNPHIPPRARPRFSFPGGS